MTDDVEPPGADAALRTTGLGKRYRRGWALRDCSLALPRGRVAGLVGPNGSGKTTLLKLAVGLVAPTEGEIAVLGVRPGARGAPAGVSFLSQDKPLYPSFRVAEMLRVGAELNSARGSSWDAALARRLVEEAEVPLDAPVRSLSGGQRTRVALALALGRRPALLLLDEPLADLDPLARRQVMGALMAEVAQSGATVLLSSHVLADLDGVCDHLLLLRHGRLGLSGSVDGLLAAHRTVSGPSREVDPLLPPGRTVLARRTGRQTVALVRGPLPDAGRVHAEPVSLDTLVVGYLEAPVPAGSPVAQEVPA